MEQVPYQTNKAALVEKIAELVENKVLLSSAKCLIGCLGFHKCGNMQSF